MPRKKQTDTDDLLTHVLRIRLDRSTYDRMIKLRDDSGYRSTGEVVRRILSGRKLQLFYKDISMNAPMEEMALIRKELRAIGVNINQITRHFNQDKEGRYRQHYVIQVAGLYKTVDQNVERLLVLIEKLAEKWLQKS